MDELLEMPQNEYTELQNRVFELRKLHRELRVCNATTATGRKCGCPSDSFGVFCHGHLRQGYGLFTLAVLARIGAAIEKK